MPNYTTNYNLKKPLESEFYDVADQNGNMDMIDSALKNLQKGKADLVDGKIIIEQLPITSLPVATTSGNSTAYTVTINGLTEINPGVLIIIIPHITSGSIAPTLNVNQLGAKTISRRSVSTNAGNNGYSANWLTANKPVLLMYDGTYWVVIGLPKPNAADLTGTLSVSNGGTGKTAWETNRLMFPSNTATITQLPFPAVAKSILQQDTSGAPYWSSPNDLTSSLDTATNDSKGLLSAADKAKLDGIAPNANNYTHPTTAGNKHIPSGGSSGKILRWSSNGTAVWGDDQDTTYSPATTTSNGLMSSSDKTKLNGIATGANKYTHPATHPASMITGLADVATSGDFADLDNPPILKGTGIGAVILSSNPYNKSSGTYSASLNGNTNAVGSYSTAAGHQTTANGYQFVCGKYNTALDEFNDQNKNGYLVAVGNGNSRANSNALTLSGAGVLNCSEYATIGGDYSELFEWADQNSNGEDRRGRFVTLDGNKIKIADADDHYILGIVSATPAVTGNNPNQWHQMYLLDVFGQPLTEEVEIPAHTDPDTGEEVPATTVIREILNPDYDPEQVYIPRSDRPEWASIGMMGQLVVIDDGTCEVNGYCKPTYGGIATSDPDGPYRVMERLDSTHIRVLFTGVGKI